MYVKDTIAAISTPPGEGGIGIVRVSGPEAEAIGARMFRICGRDGFLNHHLHYGEIIDPGTGRPLDEAMAVLMKTPCSYTREDVLELHCHGGSFMVQQVLDTALQCGARLADPGEFTRRAFLNGRIDLVQAEAVMDIIAAKSEESLKLALRQQKGRLSEHLEAIRGHLLKVLACIEAYIDFPEDDIGTLDMQGIKDSAAAAQEAISSLLMGYDEGRIIREGIAVLIIGKPNVGKSSLLNLLLNEARAIVTHIPGTTRDIIEETISIDGLAVRLLDTAGIRHTDDIIEQEGISRAMELIPTADLVLCVLDESRFFDEQDARVLEAAAHKKCIIVRNKGDLPGCLALPEKYSSHPGLRLSAKTGAGAADIRKMIRNTFLADCRHDSREYAALSRTRHRDALSTALNSIETFLQGLAANRGLELLSIDIRGALDSVASITGETVTDDLLDQIFSSFCIGK